MLRCSDVRLGVIDDTPARKLLLKCVMREELEVRDNRFQSKDAPCMHRERVSNHLYLRGRCERASV
ncbi:hypothetical protein ACLOJK_032506 [Asimina triloba]